MCLTFLSTYSGKNCAVATAYSHILTFGITGFLDFVHCPARGGKRMARVRFLAGVTDFSLLVLGPIQPPIQSVPEAVSPDIK
jgi:hypothetical protein